MLRGFLYHLGLTVRNNFRTKQPLIYGYLVPVFFLIAFGAVFRGGKPPLLRQMSQLITLSALGGACFGLPTALVAERERGLWRRFRLLPRALAPLVASTLLARFVLIASAALLQIVLALLLYGTPLPRHPVHFAVAYAAVAWAFLGLGLLIAALAEDVPAVQALGQCVFLPLIMIGGVGVPLLALPDWAQRLASFLPGRYAVDALQTGYTGDGAGGPYRFNLLALAVIGLAAGVAGAKLFRWDQGHRPLRGAGGWVVAAVVPWLAIGLFVVHTERWHALAPGAPNSSAEITAAQIQGIDYRRLPPDEGVFTPLAPADYARRLSPERRARLKTLSDRLKTWAPAQSSHPSEAIRALLNVAAVADVAEDRDEAQIARVILDTLRSRYRMDILERGLAWVALYPQEGEILTALPDLGIKGDYDARELRGRSAIYAQKFLGRILGRITEEPDRTSKA